MPIGVPIAEGKQTNRQTKQKTTGVGEDVEKLEPSHSVGRNVKWCSHCVRGKRVVPQKLKIVTI